MTAMTVPAELATQISQLAPRCDMPVHRRHNDTECPNTAAWIDWYSCNCADRMAVATCHVHHQEFVRHSREYICVCMFVPRYLDSERIGRAA